MDLLDRMTAWEAGELDVNSEAELFQELVDTGLAWSLQGTYGRTAASLVRAGLVVAR
jgi:hypothetical protein